MFRVNLHMNKHDLGIHSVPSVHMLSYSIDLRSEVLTAVKMSILFL
jgi:hypothetical protein